MKDLTSMFINSNVLLTAGTALFVIIIAVLAFFTAKKFGIKYIKTAESIVTFARNLLLQLGFNNEKANSIMSVILRAVSYALAVDSASAIEEKVKVSLDFFNKMLLQFEKSGTKIVLDDSEINVLETVFKLTFIFINTLGISKKHVQFKSLQKYHISNIER
ncbi:hypothetical protein [Clostridium oryzae]|uniref:Uncharacterized protein n=1 Tax=Clostridium oryzae TaxID=1450648 RepID=A0A1V4IKA0_9CLOT|nr:hypothetical protein [Clostridium oryzae]OPJ60333.1 hypothetical protein CLORY_29080 [Clostridium oryzae]